MLQVSGRLRPALAIWPLRDGGIGMPTMEGFGLTVLVAMCAGVLYGCWLLWARRARPVPRATERTRAPDPPQIARLDEDPLPTGKAAHEFWVSLHRLPHWRTLSHVFQSDTRMYLREAKDAAEKGNQAGALFFLGKAHEAAFNAVKPEAQVQRAIRAMTDATTAAKNEAVTNAAEAVRGGRPGDRWGGQSSET